MLHDALQSEGQYEITCFTQDGAVKWSTTSPNLVTVSGANLMLDCAFSHATPGTAYSGLISNSNFSAIKLTDTMVTKGWTESSCHGTTRQSVQWQSANSAKKVWSIPLRFVVVAPDTVAGCFLAYGAASPTVGNTDGTLWSATTFSNGTQPVEVGDTIAIQYVTSLLRLSINRFIVVQVESGVARDTQAAIVPLEIDNEQGNAIDGLIAVTVYNPAMIELGIAADTSVPRWVFAKINVEFGSLADTENAATAYHMATSETGILADTTSAVLFTGGALFLVATHETGTATDSPILVSVATALSETAALADSTYILPIYVLDENGNFVTDDAGVRIIQDGTGP